VGGSVDFFRPLRADVSVYLGGGEAGVAEERLDTAEVSTIVEEMGGKAVPELVGADTQRDIRFLEVFAEDIGNGTCGNTPFQLTEKKGTGIDLDGVTVALECLQRMGPDRADTFFFPLPYDTQGLVVDIDIGNVEGNEFREADTRTVKDLHDGGIPGREPAGRLPGLFDFEGQREELLDLLHREHDREFFLELGELDIGQRVSLQPISLGEELIETTECGEAEPDGGARHLTFLALEEV